MSVPETSTVVFDLGAVLIDWDPRYLYRQLFTEAAAMEEFLATVCNQTWNEKQDAGRPFADGVDELIADHPDQAELIRAYDERWDEMLGGAISGSVDLLVELDQRGVPLYALSNWSAEKFVHARERFAFLDRFRAIVISGEVGVNKPDPRIFTALIEANQLDRAELVFIDDVAANVAAAEAQGIAAIHFHDPDQLRRALSARGLVAPQLRPR